MPFNVVSKCSFVFNRNDRMVPSLRLVTVTVYSKAIIISQRISSIEDADKIVIMNAGTIEDVGTHEELLARNVGYRTLFETQTRGKD